MAVTDHWDSLLHRPGFRKPLLRISLTRVSLSTWVQVAGLAALGIRVAALTSLTHKEQATSILRQMEDPASGFQLLYVTPERVGCSACVDPAILAWRWAPPPPAPLCS